MSLPLPAPESRERLGGEIMPKTLLSKAISLVASLVAS